MNKELEQCLTQFINKALDVANKGIDTAGASVKSFLFFSFFFFLNKGDY